MALIKCPECEKEVSNSAVMCPNCGYAVREHFENIERQKQAQIANAEAERQKTVETAIQQRTFALSIKSHILPILITFVTLLVIVIVAVVSNHIVLSKRTVFENDKEMIEFLTGDWTDRDNDSDLYYPICRFSEIGCENLNLDLRKNADNFISGNAIECHPKRGFVVAGSTKYIITNDGKLTYKSALSKETVRMFKLSTEVTAVDSGYEDIFVKLNSVLIDTENKTVSIKGTLKNTGNLTYNGFETLLFIIKDESGKITIDRTSKFVLMDNYKDLEPGDTREFSTQISTPHKLKSSYSVSAYAANYYSNYEL